MLTFFRNIIFPLLSMLTIRDKRRGTGIVFLLSLNALLDFISLASFLPLIFLLVNPEILTQKKYLLWQPRFQSPEYLITLLTLSLLLFTIVKNLIALKITRAKASYTFDLGSKLSSRALAKYMTSEYLKFTTADYARELNRIASQPIAFANNIIMPIGTLLSEGIVFLLLLVGVIAFDYKVAFMIAIILLPVGLIYRLNRASLKQTSHDLKEKYPLTLKYGLQAVEGLLEINIFGKGAFFKERFKTHSQALSKAFAREHTAQIATSRMTEIFAVTTLCALIIYSVTTSTNYQQTILLLGVYAGISFRMIPSLNRILNSLLQIKTHEYLFKELEGIIVWKDHVNTPHDSISPDLGFSDELVISKLSFNYPASPEIFNDAQLTIRKGDKIALTGKSGSGKTTLLLLMMGLLKPSSGVIMVDGVEGDSNSSRGLFSYVPQHPYILDGTIIENIALGIPPHEVDVSKIEKILQELNLDMVVSNMPMGLDTRIGEKGIRLSGGQRQRVAIARALYAGRDILLLDEITNQLDAETEQEVLDALDKVAQQNKTIVMITHHPGLLRRFNRIIRLENQVLEDDYTFSSKITLS